MSDLKAQDSETDSMKDKVAGAAGEAASTVTEQGQAVAQTAASEARDVAAHAKDQVQTLTAETRDQAKQALSSATSEVETQLENRLGDLTSMARTTAEELRALCDGRPEDAGRTADLARQASDRLDRFAERTDQLGVRGAAEEIADFGRRRPVAFLLGAAAAGVLVGRMARAGKSVQDSSPPASSSSSSPPVPSPSLGSASVGGGGAGSSTVPAPAAPLATPEVLPGSVDPQAAPHLPPPAIGSQPGSPSAPLPGADR